MCADALAAIGFHLDSDFVIYDFAPHEVRLNVIDDASGVFTLDLFPCSFSLKASALFVSKK